MKSIIIVGHARSGTTILLNALNSSPEIYLLGECHSYLNGDLPAFRTRYNDQHERWLNQATKSCYVPALPGIDQDASCNAYLAALANHVRYTGEKVALGPERLAGTNFAALQNWLEEKHWHSLILCPIRHPRAVIESCCRKFGGDIPQYIESFARSLLACIHAARILPNVYFLNHDALSQTHFNTIGQLIDVHLEDVSDIYKNERPIKYDFGNETSSATLLRDLDETYSKLVDAIDQQSLTFSRPQLQIEQALPPQVGPYPTPIGDIVRSLIMIAREAQKLDVGSMASDSEEAAAAETSRAAPDVT